MFNSSTIEMVEALRVQLSCNNTASGSYHFVLLPKVGGSTRQPSLK